MRNVGVVMDFEQSRLRIPSIGIDREFAPASDTGIDVYVDNPDFDLATFTGLALDVRDVGATMAVEPASTAPSSTPNALQANPNLEDASPQAMSEELRRPSHTRSGFE